MRTLRVGSAGQEVLYCKRHWIEPTTIPVRLTEYSVRARFQQFNASKEPMV